MADFKAFPLALHNLFNLAGQVFQAEGFGQEVDARVALYVVGEDFF